MNKYIKLWEYLKNNDKERYELTYDEIQDILGFNIDHSFLSYKKELIKYGYKVEKIHMKERKIVFVKLCSDL